MSSVSDMAANLRRLLGEGPADDPDRSKLAARVSLDYASVNSVATGLVRRLADEKEGRL